MTPGGAIVPGYLALFVFRPSQILVALVIAMLTYWIVHRHLRPRFMLWGRKLFEAEILVVLLLQSLWLGMLFLFTPVVPQITLLYGIGFLLPGIIAHDMGRQGMGKTIWAAIICALIVFGLTVLVGAFRDILALPSLPVNALRSAQAKDHAYPIDWLLIATAVSVLMSIVLYHRGLFIRTWLPGSVRSGGFITAGYLALFVNRPWDLLFTLLCASLTYVFVTRFVMKHAILFGRTKMATMFLTGMLVTWLVELLVFSGGLDYVPWAGFNAIAPAIIALLANDAQRQGPKRTLMGVTVSTLAVFAIMSLVYFGYDALSTRSLITWHF